jgi:hypothetical protein
LNSCDRDLGSRSWGKRLDSRHGDDGDEPNQTTLDVFAVNVEGNNACAWDSTTDARDGAVISSRTLAGKRGKGNRKFITSACVCWNESQKST